MTDIGNRIMVMGVGNPLMLDDGTGPRVIEVLLESFDFPANVELLDAGTMGFSILDIFREIDHLIVVDAVKNTGHEPGTVLLLSPEDMAQNEIIRSAHDTQLIEVLKAAAMIGHVPQTMCVGVQIQSIQEWVLELSEPVAAAIPVAAAAVLGQLRQLGVEPVLHPESADGREILEIAETHAPTAEEQSPGEV